MSSLLVSEVENIISKIMHTISSNYKIKIDGKSEKGDGYVGEITFVTITTEKHKNDLNLVIKSAKKSEALRKMSPLGSAYNREIQMYSKIFPALRDFQEIVGVNKIFDPAPKMFYAENETLVLENIKSLGYQLWDRTKPMNLDHAVTVFSYYGKWHALTTAYKEKHVEDFYALTNNMTNVMKEFNIQFKMEQNFKESFDSVIKILEKEEKHDLCLKFFKFKDHIINFVNAENFENDPVIITHGDCWINNMMFFYEDQDTAEPSKMYFLDFQLSRVASPVLDLSYYLYSSGDKKLFEHFDYLLQVYYSEFIRFAKELGANVEKLFTFTQLREQWKKYGMFGVLMATLVVKIEISDPDESPDMVATAEGDGDFAKAFNVAIKNQDVYESRMLDVFTHFGENFL